jgi:hypothetical protein
MNDKVRRSSHIDYKKIYTTILKHKKLYYVVLPSFLYWRLSIHYHYPIIMFVR